MVQAPTKLSQKYIYELNATDDLPSGIIPLAVDHRIDNKYPNPLNIPLQNTEYNTNHIPRKTIIGKLQAIEIEDIEVSNISWTKDNADTANSLVELLSMLPESRVQPEHSNLKQLIILQDAQLQQEAKDKLSSLLEGNKDSIVSKSPMDVGRTNLFSKGYPYHRTSHCTQSIPNSTKVSNIHWQGNTVFRKCSLHIYSLSPWAAPMIIVPQNKRPLKCSKATALLSIGLLVTQ